MTQTTQRAEVYANMLNTMQDLSMSMQTVEFDEERNPIQEQIIITDFRGNRIELERIAEPDNGREVFDWTLPESDRALKLKPILTKLTNMGFLGNRRIWNDDHVIVPTKNNVREKIYFA